ncbi:MAG TPA: lipoyl(octanoyl) transferase LipB, partial [Candidatus Binatia bacterium]|nr:lipoyl(octanoyl) transferase LipB [Candidatus Binatia bacterium]
AIPDTLLLLEHPHVYTLGRNGKREHLLVPAERLRAPVVETDRGGEVTYHGPAQLVGYPILDLTRHRRDLGWYMGSLEEVFVRVAADFGVRAGRLPGAPGVWVGNDKLVAVGVHVSRWVTSHGFAFNVNTDLSYFRAIVPCGLRDKGVTSIERLLGRRAEMQAAAERVVERFGEVFGMEMRREVLSSSVLSHQFSVLSGQLSVPPERFFAGDCRPPERVNCQYLPNTLGHGEPYTWD